MPASLDRLGCPGPFTILGQCEVKLGSYTYRSTTTGAQWQCKPLRSCAFRQRRPAGRFLRPAASTVSRGARLEHSGMDVEAGRTHDSPPLQGATDVQRAHFCLNDHNRCSIGGENSARVAVELRNESPDGVLCHRCHGACFPSRTQPHVAWHASARDSASCPAWRCVAHAASFFSSDGQ